MQQPSAFRRRHFAVGISPSACAEIFVPEQKRVRARATVKIWTRAGKAATTLDGDHSMLVMAYVVMAHVVMAGEAATTLDGDRSMLAA